MQTELVVTSPTHLAFPPFPIGELGPETPASLILFGRDDRGRPHASRFDLADREGAEAAANLMGMQILVADDERLRMLAAGLPAGRLFESGRAFVPFVRGEVYAQILSLGGIAEPVRASLPPKSAAGGLRAAKGDQGGSNAAAGPGGAATGAGGGDGGAGGAPPKRPIDWAGIGIGSQVLVCNGPMEGWFEAVVVHTKADDSFELRWRDWPDEPLESRKRGDLALLPPNSTEGMA